MATKEGKVSVHQDLRKQQRVASWPVGLFNLYSYRVLRTLVGGGRPQPPLSLSTITQATFKPIHIVNNDTKLLRILIAIWLSATTITSWAEPCNGL